MKTEIYVNGKETEIELTEAQAESISKAFAQLKEKKRPVVERIKSYEDACADQDIKPLTLEQFSFLPEKDREYHFFDHQQVIIKRALNEGWEPNHNDDNEEKWFVWYKSVGSGRGFAFLSRCVSSDSCVGARHEFRTKQLAEYYAKQFISIVNTCFIIKKSK